MSSHDRSFRARRSRRKLLVQPILESLETRVVLSSASSSIQLSLEEFHAAGTYPTWLKPSPTGILPQDNGFTSPVGYVPQQLQTAYGLNQISFNGVTGDGTGQTIAIVDAYDDPDFLDSTDPKYSTSDLAQFDAQLGVADPPSFTKFNEHGSTTNLPGTDPAGAGNANGNWEIEEALDIEWAHAMAPGAGIDIVEASNSNTSSLFKAINTASTLPGVSVVSMSWGLNETAGETSYDSSFTTSGVTYIASSGDSGSPGYYPAYSPDVVAAGGTSLPLDDNGDYPGTAKDGGEVAWSGSGGGISTVEKEPAFQENVQTTGFRAMPDVAWDADPSTGVAVYDSYNDVDNSGPWVEVGGTSVSAPSWSGVLAIVNQGRILAGGETLSGASQTLPALYTAPSQDFHDILYGSNGGFTAGPGYDEVTGLGSPDGSLLVPYLVSYDTADQIVATGQPPANVIAGDSFGIAVSAEDDFGSVDLGFDGTLTLSLANNPTGATLNGNLTATAQNGVAVFDGLSINEIGSGYTIEITSSQFPSIITSAFNVTANTTPWEGTYYPVAVDSSLRADITAAEDNSFADNTIVLSAATYTLTDLSLGQLVLQNPSTSQFKTLTFVGQGETSSIIAPGVSNWADRDIEILGSSGAGLAVVFQDLAIDGGNATNGGTLGGTSGLGGGLLVDGGAVLLSNVALSGNHADGAVGSNGAKGSPGHGGASAGSGDGAQGGGIYLAAGNLTLNDVVFSKNSAKGGIGGKGGTGGIQTTLGLGATGAPGGNGGAGGTAKGGAVYVAGGQLVMAGADFSQNEAIGGAGGSGGSAGKGKVGFAGGLGGRGGAAAAAQGGAIYLAGGSLTVTASLFQNNSAIGGYGGHGGSGGVGGGALAGSSSLFGTSIFGSGFARIHRDTRITPFSTHIGSAPGGTGGKGGDGAAAAGGAIYVGGGTLALSGSTLSGNQAQGGAGGHGGVGGIGGIGSMTNGSFLPAGYLGGTGGHGGNGAAGSGAGLYVAAGTVTVYGTTWSDNSAVGGQGGTGGTGGLGGLAAIFGSGSIGGSGSGSLARLRPDIFGSGTGTTFSFGGSGAITGGPGGDGGNGGVGQAGAVYVSGGTITFINTTIADNSAQEGAAGAGGPGGKAGTGNVTGGMGNPGIAGSAHGGAFYIAGGTINFFNDTVADNSTAKGGSGGGFDIIAGTVLFDSTIVALNTVGTGTGATASDVLGSVVSTSMYDLIGNANGLGGISNGKNHNKVGVSNPGLASLAENGGLTQTIALKTGSPAIAAGFNPESLFADQRGYEVPANTAFDIGAYQTQAIADTTAPGATLQATNVNSSNAGSLNPYTFSITYSDNVAVSIFSLPGASVVVATPGIAPVTATVISTKAVGSSDAVGDAPEFTVTYQITPPGGSWSADDNGTYTVSLVAAPITDLAGNSISGAVGTFTVDVLTDQLVVTTEPPASVDAGTAFGLTVSVENSQGVIQSGFTGAVTIGLENDPDDGVLNGTLTVDAIAGVATFAGLTIEQAASGYTILATSPGLISQTSNPFDITPAAASQLIVSTQPPTSTTAGNSFGLTLSAEDKFGNLTPAFTGAVTIALDNNPDNGTLDGTLTVDASAGVAAFTGLTLDQAADGYTIEATTTGLTSVTTNPFDITPAAASQLVVTSEPPASTTAGDSFGLTVSAEDKFGNLTPTFTSAITIALENNPGNGTLNGTLTVDAGAGVATFSGLTLDQAADGYTIEATTTGLSAGTTSPFDITPAATSQLVVTSEPPASTTAGITFALTVSAEDKFGNLAPSFTSSVTIALENNPGDGTLNGTLNVSAGAGVATFSGLTIDQAADGYTIEATTTGLPSVTTNPFDITPAAASQLVVTSEPPASTMAGDSFGLTVSAEDKFGNLTPTFTSDITIALESNPGDGMLNGTLTVSAGAGVATFSGLTLDQAANGYTIEATTTGLSAGTTNPFDITPAAPAQLVVSTEPPASTVAGDPFGLAIAAEDSFGNPTPSFTSAVTIALDNNPGDGTLNGTLTVSASAGVATFSGLSIDQSANGYTIDATASSLTTAITSPFDITPVPVADQLVVTSQPPASTTAGKSFGLTLAVENNDGEVDTGFNSAVTIAIANNPGNGTLNGTLTVTASAGVADFSGLTLDQAANGYTIMATSSGVTAGTTDPFDITPAAPAQLVVTTEPPADVTAGNQFGLTVSAEDAFGNVTSSFTGPVSIALKSNPGHDILKGTLKETAQDGVATFSGLTLTRAASGYTIQVTTKGLTTGLSSAFAVVPAASAQLVVTGEPPAIVTAGNSFGLTVSAEDAYGNLTPSFTGTVTLALQTNPGNGTLYGPLVVNATAGVAEFSGLAIDTAARGYIIQGTTTGGLTLALTRPFTIAPAAATQLVVTTQPPASIPVGNAFGLVISAEDRYGNLVPSEDGTVTIALQNNPSNATLSGRKTIGLDAGVATFSGLSLNKPGTGFTIQGVRAGLTPAVTDPFDVTADAAIPALSTIDPRVPSTGLAAPTPVPASLEHVSDQPEPTASASVPVVAATSAVGNSSGPIGTLSAGDNASLPVLPAQPATTAKKRPGSDASTGF